jgi:hypothetical protein
MSIRTPCETSDALHRAVAGCLAGALQSRPPEDQGDPMNIIFLEPAFPANQREFVRALASIGATVYGIGERPADWLDDETRSRLAGYWQIKPASPTSPTSNGPSARP